MLIRSQDKESLLSTKTILAFSISGGEDNFEICAETAEYSWGIGFYSSREKAIAVLDVIQDACIRYALNECIIPKIAITAKGMPQTIRDETLSSAMVLQMPKDDEVKI